MSLRAQTRTRTRNTLYKASAPRTGDAKERSRKETEGSKVAATDYVSKNRATKASFYKTSDREKVRRQASDRALHSQNPPEDEWLSFRPPRADRYQIIQVSRANGETCGLWRESGHILFPSPRFPFLLSYIRTAHTTVHSTRTRIVRVIDTKSLTTRAYPHCTYTV